MSRLWEYRIVKNGFTSYLYCRGEEKDVVAYIESEYPHEKSWHHALSPEQEEMVYNLHLTVYIAPKSVE